jgi:hypothetical protein
MSEPTADELVELLGLYGLELTRNHQLSMDRFYQRSATACGHLQRAERYVHLEKLIGEKKSDELPRDVQVALTVVRTLSSSGFSGDFLYSAFASAINSIFDFEVRNDLIMRSKRNSYFLSDFERNFKPLSSFQGPELQATNADASLAMVFRNLVKGGNLEAESVNEKVLELAQFGFPVEAVSFGPVEQTSINGGDMQRQSILSHYQQQVLVLLNAQSKSIDVIISRFLPAFPSQNAMKGWMEYLNEGSEINPSLSNYLLTELNHFKISRILKMSIPFTSAQCLTISNDLTCFTLQCSEAPKFSVRRALCSSGTRNEWRHRKDFTKRQLASKWLNYVFVTQPSTVRGFLHSLRELQRNLPELAKLTVSPLPPKNSVFNEVVDGDLTYRGTSALLAMDPSVVFDLGDDEYDPEGMISGVSEVDEPEWHDHLMMRKWEKALAEEYVVQKPEPSPQVQPEESSNALPPLEDGPPPLEPVSKQDQPDANGAISPMPEDATANAEMDLDAFAPEVDAVVITSAPQNEIPTAAPVHRRSHPASTARPNVAATGRRQTNGPAEEVGINEDTLDIDACLLDFIFHERNPSLWL